jgi:acyl-coenzyme A thioesterase PaaI-like protein
MSVSGHNVPRQLTLLTLAVSTKRDVFGKIRSCVFIHFHTSSLEFFMDIFSIPFNQLIGLEISDDPEYLMLLPARPEYANHIQTVHASALFALAEASSGLCLFREFAELENVVPVVRNVEVKYRKPGQGTIRSKASVNADKTTILETLQTKHRALISVQVSLFNDDGILVMQATFEWFILINPESSGE